MDSELRRPPGSPPDPVGRVAQAKFEHEAAALDLSDAAQAAARSSAAVDRGDLDVSQRLTEMATQLYKSSCCHRDSARRLDSEERLVEGSDS